MTTENRKSPLLSAQQAKSCERSTGFARSSLVASTDARLVSLGVWGEMLDPASEVKGGSTMRENCVWLGIGDTRRATFQGRIKSPAKGEAGNCAA
jgi:hypothetical protein